MNESFPSLERVARDTGRRASSMSLRVTVALLALCFSGVALAAKKIERTTKTPKPGSPCSVAEQACISEAGAGCSTQACKDGKLDVCTKNYNKCVDDNQPVASKKAVRKTEQDCQAENARCRNVLCATSAAGNDRFACEINCDTGLAKCRKDNGLDANSK